MNGTYLTNESIVSLKAYVKSLEYPETVFDMSVSLFNEWISDSNDGLFISSLYEKNKGSSYFEVIKFIYLNARALIKKDLSNKIFDLDMVINTKSAQCVGYTVFINMIFACVNICFKAIDVIKLPNGKNPGTGHLASLVSLPTGEVLIVDAAKGYISQTFDLSNNFNFRNNIYEIINETNPIELYRKFIILEDNGLSKIHMNRGKLFCDLKKYYRAINEFKRAIKIFPDDADSYYNLGNVYNVLGQKKLNRIFKKSVQYYKEAIKYYSIAIKKDDCDFYKYKNRGYVYFFLKEYQNAFNDLQVAITLIPDQDYKSELDYFIYKCKLKF
jgi:tetratricopeptide (TPR) repeat protein